MKLTFLLDRLREREEAVVNVECMSTKKKAVDSVAFTCTDIRVKTKIALNDILRLN